MQKTAAVYGFPKLAGDLRHAYASSGYRAALRTWAVGLDRNGVNRPAMVAAAYARAGDKDLAFYWLERAYQDHDDLMLCLNTDPPLASLRSDPRFKDLVRRVGLPP